MDYIVLGGFRLDPRFATGRRRESVAFGFVPAMEVGKAEGSTLATVEGKGRMELHARDGGSDQAGEKVTCSVASVSRSVGFRCRLRFEKCLDLPGPRHCRLSLQDALTGRSATEAAGGCWL